MQWILCNGLMSSVNPEIQADDTGYRTGFGTRASAKANARIPGDNQSV